MLRVDLSHAASTPSRNTTTTQPTSSPARACCRLQSSLPRPELVTASRAYCRLHRCRVQSFLPPPSVPRAELVTVSRACCRLQSLLTSPELAAACRVCYRLQSFVTASRARCLESSLPLPDLAPASRTRCLLQARCLLRSSLPAPKLAAASRACCRCISGLTTHSLTAYLRDIYIEPRARSATIAKIVNRTLT